jgi:hypothetical protein
MHACAILSHAIKSGQDKSYENTETIPADDASPDGPGGVSVGLNDRSVRLFGHGGTRGGQEAGVVEYEQNATVSA